MLAFGRGIRWYSSSTTWFQGCSCHVLRRLGGPSSSVQHSRPQWAIMSWHSYWPQSDPRRMPDSDLAFGDLNRNEFVPRDSLGQANVAESF